MAEEDPNSPPPVVEPDKPLPNGPPTEPLEVVAEEDDPKNPEKAKKNVLWSSFPSVFS